MKRENRLKILVGLAVFGLWSVLSPDGSAVRWLVRTGFARGITSEGATNRDTDTANPVPLIAQPLVPDTTAPGGSGFTLTVRGAGFVSASVVNWNGSPRATTFVSSAQLSAAISASDIAQVSTAFVTVANPSPGGGMSNVVFFPITPASLGVTISSTVYDTGFGPSFSVVTADFDDDGKLDLAFAHDGNPSGVAVMLGAGDGTFQAAMDNTTGVAPEPPVTADFNGDGRLDMAVANFADSTVSVLLGNGDGTFQPQVTFATGTGPTALIAADFNRDGKLDLLGADSSGAFIMLGNGDGTFQSAMEFAPGFFPAVTTDLNADGVLDLAGTTSAGISVALGKGDGKFANPVSVAGLVSGSLVAADLNGDGRQDLAVTSSSSNDVYVALGNGNGTFQSPTTFTTARGPGGIVTGDFNGDGRLDLATANCDTSQFPCIGTASILLGNGDGSFQPHVDFSLTVGPFNLSAGDFNRDGRLDLVTNNIDLSSDTLAVLLQPAQGPQVQLSSTSLMFGTQLIGTIGPKQDVMLTNTGTSDLSVSSVAVSGSFLSRNTCGSTVPAGANCTINVAFKPTVKGNAAGAVTITDNAPTSPQVITLTGSGTVVELAPSPVNFGSQRVGTTSPKRRVRLSNTGDGVLHISGIVLRGKNAGDFSQTNSCGATIAAHSSCPILVNFSPRAKGTRTATVSVTDDGGGSPQTVFLTGTGT